MKSVQSQSLNWLFVNVIEKLDSVILCSQDLIRCLKVELYSSSNVYNCYILFNWYFLLLLERYKFLVGGGLCD